MNITSQDIAGIAPALMYESIFKTATNNQDFKFKIKTVPYPPTYTERWRTIGSDAAMVVFMTAVSYSIMIVAVISHIVVERTNGLKHLQVISGMQLKAYWIGNFIFDLCKMSFTVLATIAIFVGFSMDYEAAWLTYLLIPFAILPFTYVSSFLFTEDSAA